MEKEKIIEVFNTAIAYLRNSMEGVVEKDENKIINFVWLASSNLEYALFCFLLNYQEETNLLSLNGITNSKQILGESLLASAERLLKEARADLHIDKYNEAHKKMLISQKYLFKFRNQFYNKSYRKK